MTATFYIGSNSKRDVFPAEGSGISEVDARRAAIQFVRARHGIADPVVLAPHEAAVRLRQAVLQAHRPQMANLNGRRGQWWAAPTRIADCYSNR